MKGNKAIKLTWKWPSHVIPALIMHLMLHLWVHIYWAVLRLIGIRLWGKKIKNASCSELSF